MEHGSIINDLAIVVVCAAVVTVLFRALHLPVLLGYLLSGLLVGPHFLPHSPIKDLAAIEQLRELGVAFLMFYIGLEFDLQKLQRTLGPALLAVILQTVVMIFVGILTAPLLGWSSINGLFLGCLLAISSTMVTLPILRAQDALKANFAQAAIGMLILEDILAILVLVILTAVGLTGKFQWHVAWKSIFFVGVFIVMVFFVGKLVAPRFLKLLRKFGNPEMITVVAVASILGVGQLAEYFHFSIALGAFLAGSILSQSDLAHEIEDAIEPLRDLFTAVFFVSIGMDIDLNLLAKYWVSIVSLSLIVIVGKTLTVWIGLFLTGEKPRTAFKAAVCKAQIGEFSFVIAALGIQQHVTDPGIMAIAVGVALGTIMIVPSFSNNAGAIFDYLAKRTPRGVKESGEFYNSFLLALKEQLGRSAFVKIIKKPILHIIVYFLLFNGILILAYLGIGYIDQYPQLSDYGIWAQAGIWVLAAFLCLPFLIAIIKNLEVIVLLVTESVFTLKGSRLLQRGNMRNIVNTGILCIVVVLLGGIYLSAASTFLPTGVASIAFIGLVIVFSTFFWRHIVRVNSRLEQLFIQSFTSELKLTNEERREKMLKAIAQKHPWGIDLYDVEIKDDVLVCGKQIWELNLRGQTGVSVVGISRDNFTIFDPGPEVPLFPGDHVILVGDQQQIQKARDLLSQKNEGKEICPAGKFEIDTVYLPSESPMVGSTLADANIRRLYKINIIGIQRGVKKILSPGPDEILKARDILVVVGNHEVIKTFKEQIETGKE